MKKSMGDMTNPITAGICTAVLHPSLLAQAVANGVPIIFTTLVVELIAAQ